MDPAAIALAPGPVEEDIGDEEDRASIVGRCTREAGYTSEEQAKVLVLMGGFRDMHKGSDIVTDTDQDTISCRRCKLKRTHIIKNGKGVRGSQCPEESSNTTRARLITGLSNIRTCEEAVPARLRFRGLAELIM